MADTRAAVHRDFTATVARNVEEVERLRDIWQRFSAHVNVDIDYFLTVTESGNQGVRPHVIVLFDSADPVGMLIGRVEEGRFEMRVGYKVVCAPRARTLAICYGGALGAESAPVAEALVAELEKTLARKEADLVRMNFLPVDSPLYRIAASTAGVFRRDHIRTPNRHYVVRLPDTYEEYLGSRSKNTRENIRRYGRRLVKKYGERLSIVHYRDEKDIDRMLADVETIASKTYQRGLRVGLGDNEQSRRILTLAARRGWLHLYVLSIDDTPCAFWPGYLYKGNLLIDIPGYDPAYTRDRVGNFLFMKFVEDLCENPEAQVVDFGFGDAQYKRSFATDSWDEGVIHIFAPTVKGIVLNVTRTAVALVERLARAVLERTSLLNRVKAGWRKRVQQSEGKPAAEREKVTAG